MNFFLFNFIFIFYFFYFLFFFLFNFFCNKDGTVRAFDLVRYRNFRILTSPKPTQFSCVCVDNAGEIVCAGSSENYGVFVWSLQTGKLLEILPGHIAPVSSVAFNPFNSMLVSTSWDKTARMWDIFKGNGSAEILNHSSDVLAVAFRSDGKELCTCNLRGVLSFWDPNEKELKGSFVFFIYFYFFFFILFFYLIYFI